jgi:hypothetical protein
VYSLFFLFFVPFYMASNEACNLQLGVISNNTFLDAFYLSVESAVTIGSANHFCFALFLLTG